MAPYRTVDRDPLPESPRDPGIVGEVIAQFADPLAFYRELVQNSIDAGTPSIEVRLVHADQRLRVQVRDRGEGMTRDILENQLLVLFRSTKERDATKIGKFGIGFTSVLAPDPELVIVQTVRDGRRLTLHLRRDLTYQLFDGGAASQVGTTVELELTMSVDQARAFADRSRTALKRWCRHATVPIRLAVELDGQTAPAEAIEQPLGLDHPVLEVRGQSEDGAMTAVVGISREGPAAGFFNHGLTLFETDAPLLGPLSFKIQDARLGHTLSRDNVRRDASYDRALEFVRTLAAQELPRAAARALGAAAEARDPTRYAVLVQILITARIELDRRTWRIPLVEPIGGDRTTVVAELPRRAWTADGSSPLTVAVATAGHAVVPTPLHAPVIADTLRALGRVELTPLRDAFVLVEPIAATDNDLVLTDTLADHLRACRRGASTVALATLEGAVADRFAICGDPSEACHPGVDPAYVLEVATATRNPLGRVLSRGLILNTRHPIVRAARATDDPRAAATHLARAVLLHYGLLDAGRSAVLLDRALTALGVAGAPR